MLRCIGSFPRRIDAIKVDPVPSEFSPSSLLSFLVKGSQWDAELTESDVKSAANVPSVNQDSPEFRFLHLSQSE